MRRSVAAVKKTYRLPPDLVKRVKKVLHAKTETEAIICCMSEIAFMDDVERTIKETGGRAGCRSKRERGGVGRTS